MFGFSLPKILFTIAVIALVWYGFKWFTRYQEVQAEGRKSVNSGRRGASAGRKPAEPAGDAAAEEMVACSACGTYVVAKGARSCGRGDCPYPG